MGPLQGRVVATTREGSPDDPLVRALRDRGADVRIWPTIRVEDPFDPRPLEHALERLPEYAWIVFTSRRAVDAVARRVPPPHRAPKTGAVGPATAEALSARGWPVDVVGTGAGADGLVGALADAGLPPGAEVLFPASSLARDVLEEALGERGASVHRVEAYRVRPVPPDPSIVAEDLARGVDVVTFASPSAVRSLAEALDQRLHEALADCLLVAIGPTTADALRTSGCPDVRIARNTSVEALADACAAPAPTR